MTTYEPSEFIIGSICFAYATTLIICVSESGYNLSPTEAFLFAILVTMFIFKGETSIRNSRVDDDE